MKKLLLAGVLVGLMASGASALTYGLNPGNPALNYDLLDGTYLTVIGLQEKDASANFPGTTITAADLNALIISGTSLGWYYGPGSLLSAVFTPGFNTFDTFVTDTVVTGGSRSDRVWDSLYLRHSANVVFNPYGGNNGGTATAGIGGPRIQRNPLQPTSVPDGGVTAGLLGVGLMGMAAFRRRMAA